MPDLTPETLAELHRLLNEAQRRLSSPRRAGKTYAIEALRNAAVNALPALLDAATERDALAADADRWQRAALTLRGDRDALRAKLAHMTEGRDHDWAEVERLAAQVDAVRAWIDRRGVNVDDRDDEYMHGYRAAQRHALLDALELRRALDGEADRG